MIRLFPLLATLALAAPALAEEAAPWVSYESEASFEDALFELQIAIEERGYVVDHVSKVGDMLQRTAGDVGADGPIYERAEVHQFCSATLSRKMMAANAMNLAFCPYGIFLFQEAGEETVNVGYRRMPEGEMQEVQALLDEIARAAAGQE